MHGVSSGRRAPRWTLVLAHIGIVAIVFWLLLTGGAPVLPGGLRTDGGDRIRRWVLAVLAVAYLARFTFTTVYLLRREVDWSEVLMVAPWLALLHGALAWLGGRNPDPLSAVAGLGLALFALGALMGPGAEWARLRWKLRPEHRSHLYTGSLFHYTMHPNYLADVVLFTGYALVTERATALAIPLLVLAGFVFIHVPTLDRYLESRYGAEFRSYADQTARLIPGLW